MGEVDDASSSPLTLGWFSGPLIMGALGGRDGIIGHFDTDEREGSRKDVDMVAGQYYMVLGANPVRTCR